MSGKAQKVHFKVLANTSHDRGPTSFGNNSPTAVLSAGSQSPPVAVGADLSTIRSQLNVFDKILLNRDIRKELGRVLHDAYMQLAEAKRQELMLSITLHLDERKKQLFVANLEASRGIDKVIAQGSAEFTKDMLDGALAVTIHAAVEKKQKLVDLDELLQSGKIDEESHAELREETVEAMRLLSDSVKDCVSRILATHIAKVEQTLALFKERGLNSNHF